MDRDIAKSSLKVPSFARTEAYDFAANPETFEVYRELTKIAEELDKCRSRNI